MTRAVVHHTMYCRPGSGNPLLRLPKCAMIENIRHDFFLCSMQKDCIIRSVLHGYSFARGRIIYEYKYTPMPETQKAVRECIRTNAWVVRQIRMKDAVFALYMHEVGFNSIDNANAVLFVVIPSRV